MIPLYVETEKLNDLVGVSFSNYNGKLLFGLFPQISSTDDFCKYWKYAKAIFQKVNVDFYHLPNYHIDQSENITRIKDYFVSNMIFILFEFPDEETAFYFKLKYC